MCPASPLQQSPATETYPSVLRCLYEADYVLLIGAVWGQGGTHSASRGARDLISVLAITKEPTTVFLSIGDSSQELQTHHRNGHVSFFEVPVDGRTGLVTLAMHGESGQGPAISNECHPCGHVVFNCAAVEVRCV